MAYDEFLAQRLREMLAATPLVAEKKMMGGIAFMVDGKMCVGVIRENLMVRVAPESYERALGRKGCRPMDFTGQPLKGFVFVEPEGCEHNEDLRFWIDLALAFNPFAKASKKKAKRPD